ncbi:hypothetical protein MPTK1_8g15230 [Marchantia polymorpha subsp. ruderalis]|uniref:Uncharacterized protein n=1 Tax=Marchantia polymorpha TaxID=3197 RepID=A0A2R6W1F2_MARPO|nr:hypothetical protein MARPO_0187s0010 [Marchantia polymorpha]BBN19958.1 hypothetical protein Mp_8g15230 [Marchantia polymorpha subsp. ruderalis]|eukprot:PTQ27687.1 hypothetical protein MARPO_0187s0010 [Marchantia polymorpha]
MFFTRQYSLGSSGSRTGRVWRDRSLTKIENNETCCIVSSGPCSYMDVSSWAPMEVEALCRDASRIHLDKSVSLSCLVVVYVCLEQTLQ